MSEAIQRILEAAKGENPEALLTTILDHERKAAADAARGVEDVAAGLKSALEKTKAERDALKAKVEEADAAAEKARREAEAKSAGVDNAELERLAEKRAQAMSERAVAAAQDEAKRLQAELQSAVTDRSHLINRLETAYVDLDLMKSGGGDVNPLFYPLLRQNVKPFLRVDEEAEGENAWWKRDADKPPRFTVVDPQDGKTRLTGKAGPMTSGELLAQKRVGEWSDFWPRTDRGPGGSSTPGQNGGQRPQRDPMTTPGLQLLDDALFSGT